MPNWVFYTLGAKLTLLHSWCPEKVVDLEPIEEEEEQTMSRPDIVLHRNRATPNEEVSTRNSHSAALQPGALQDAVVQPSVTSQVY